MPDALEEKDETGYEIPEEHRQVLETVGKDSFMDLSEEELSGFSPEENRKILTGLFRQRGLE